MSLRSPFIDNIYLQVLADVYYSGTNTDDRTSVGSSRQLFGADIMFDTHGERAPFIQSRTFSPRIAFEEWKWMMSGSTDSKILEEKNINIWKGNTSREFLDSRGLSYLPEGDIGLSYGYQFRKFGGVVDQVKETLYNLKTDPNSRRHVISIWNPTDIDDAPLAPCAFLYEFSVIDGKLNIHQHMRSADVLFGVPYNLAFSTYWLYTFAEILGMETGKIWLTMTNAHIYENQLSTVKEMLDNVHVQRTIPTIKLSENASEMLVDVDDIQQLEPSDFLIDGFVKGPKIGNATMAI